MVVVNFFPEVGCRVRYPTQSLRGAPDTKLGVTHPLPVPRTRLKGHRRVLQYRAQVALFD